MRIGIVVCVKKVLVKSKTYFVIKEIYTKIKSLKNINKSFYMTHKKEEKVLTTILANQAIARKQSIVKAIPHVQKIMKKTILKIPTTIMKKTTLKIMTTPMMKKKTILKKNKKTTMKTVTIPMKKKKTITKKKTIPKKKTILKIMTTPMMKKKMILKKKTI